MSGDYHWGLTYIEDISGNVRHAYDKLPGVPIGQAATAAIGVSHTCADHLHRVPLRAAIDEPAYEVTFVRDREQTRGAGTSRSTPAHISGGDPQLPGRVEIRYQETAGPEKPGMGGDLEYTQAPFEKSLLARSDGSARTARRSAGTLQLVGRRAEGRRVVRGLRPSRPVGRRAHRRREHRGDRALGTAVRGGGDGGAYFGFNPRSPARSDPSVARSTLPAAGRTRSPPCSTSTATGCRTRCSPGWQTRLLGAQPAPSRLA